MMTAGLLLMTLLILAMILVEAQKRPRRVYGTLKIIASILFVVVGIVVVDDVSDAPLARPLFLGALVLSLIGDVLLVPKGHKRVFQIGLISFLLAHVVYIPAFIVRGVDWRVVGVVGVVMVLPLVLVMRWLRAHVKGGMWPAVVAYVVVISVMFSVAAGAVSFGLTSSTGVTPAVLIGALCFWLSDISVARERFVAHGFVNRLFGIPLYFYAQLALIAGYALVV